MDHGEAPDAAARRETREETLLDVLPSSILGIYVSTAASRFVYLAEVKAGQPVPGDEILEVRWFEDREILDSTDDQMVALPMLRMILRDLRSGRRHSTTLVASLP